METDLHVQTQKTNIALLDNSNTEFMHNDTFLQISQRSKNKLIGTKFSKRLLAAYAAKVEV